jgi:hypothetical protein
VRFRQILAELGVSCRQFSREAHIPAFSARFSFYVWPLPSVAAALRLYELNWAMFERAAQLAAPPQPNQPYTRETDQEARIAALAEAAKVIDELRAEDPEREGNDAAVRGFIAANQQLHTHTQSVDSSGTFDTPFGPVPHRAWYQSNWREIACWPKRVWDWWQWL